MGEEVSNTELDIRLSNIEKTLVELKDVVVENKLQAKDIQDLKSKENEILSAINAHEKRIRDLEVLPLQSKADKWSQITDTLFKSITSITMGLLLAKIGLK